MTGLCVSPQILTLKFSSHCDDGLRRGRSETLGREVRALMNEVSSETASPPSREDLRSSEPSVAQSTALRRTSLCARILGPQPPEPGGTDLC